MEDLSNMTSGIVIGKLVAFEMSCKMGQKKLLHQAKEKLSHVAKKRR